MSVKAVFGTFQMYGTQFETELEMNTFLVKVKRAIEQLCDLEGVGGHESDVRLNVEDYFGLFDRIEL